VDIESVLAALRQAASAFDRLLTEAVREIRLHWFAAKVSRDPENAAWMTQMRKRVSEGISEEDLIGHDELEKRKQAIKRER